MKKLYSRWIPHNLTKTRKTDRVTWCNAILTRFKEEASNLVWDILTDLDVLRSYEAPMSILRWCGGVRAHVFPLSVHCSHHSLGLHSSSPPDSDRGHVFNLDLASDDNIHSLMPLRFYPRGLYVTFVIALFIHSSTWRHSAPLANLRANIDRPANCVLENGCEISTLKIRDSFSVHIRPPYVEPQRNTAYTPTFHILCGYWQNG
ncbi:hypothetical protein EVAR_84372_1 [Eumeta japonica]|uniref:Uncharacterized protein n=1 Tax=Eumeta variegata TaxID=151549 RepID=A0A4C1U4C5_EUMVA|nr:hypothetical protein EVAR_84372_1 [Eumeta japonica]